MKTLKELNEKCTLIAEHKQPAFVNENDLQSFIHKDSNKCKLYTDNKGNFYLYHHIFANGIREYNNYEQAINDYIQFITNTLCYK